MEQTRGLFLKTGDTKETYYAKMGTTKDRNGLDLTEAEEIKKRVARLHGRTIQNILMTWITMMVWSLT